jgi:LDH2 family malate/lactate/ureidoglycolate dehydrogenase
VLNETDKMTLVGLAAVVIRQRKDVDYTEKIIQRVLESHGVSEEDARTWTGELTYNEGDDPVEAVNRILDVLNLEVESE